jgi:hypothetical protein
MRSYGICGLLILTWFLPSLSHSQTVWLKNTSSITALDPSVIFDSTAGLYRMWYASYGSGGIRYGISTDGTQWFFDDALALASGESGSFDRYIHSVNVTTYRGKYMMLYTCSRAQDTLKIALATSTDGLHWVKSGRGPVLQPKGTADTWESRHVGGGDLLVVNDTLYMWYGGGDGTFLSTGLARSVDGINWIRDPWNPVIQHGKPSSFNSVEATAVGVTRRDNGFYMIYRCIDSTYQHSYNLAVSTNGSTWWQYPEGPVIMNPWRQLGGGSLMWHGGLFRLWYCSGGSWSLSTAIAEAVSLPGSGLDYAGKMLLRQNYPNPFNPSTTIQVVVPAAGRLTVAIYDVLGRLVEVLADEDRDPGPATYAWHASGKASGVYLCRTSFGGQTSTTKMMLLR